MAGNKYFIILLLWLIPLKGVLSQEFTLPAFIDDMTSCDIDQDGDEDILCICKILNYDEDSIYIFYNEGDGTFLRKAYPFPNMNFILCNCINQDDYIDIVSRFYDQIYYIPNYGPSGFGDTISIADMSGTLSISEISDINNDNWNDLIYSNTSYECWGVLKNVDGFIFTNEVIQTGSSTTIPAAGLLNNDSLLDVVITYSAFSRSSVYVNNGNFNFTEVILEETFIGEPFVMNLDNQGTDDFAFANYYTKTIPLYKFIGNNQFELQSNFYAAGTYVISSFLPGDFNQDGFDDFAITRGDWGNDSDSLYIYFNDQNWSFNLNQTLYIGDLTWYKSCSSDLNGDSYPDIFMKGCNGNNIITLLWNDGFGNFSFENPVSVIDNQLSNNEFSVFPNPFSNQIEIKIPACKSMNLQVILTNVLGQNVQLINLSNPDKTEVLFYHWDGCDISGLACPPGIYLITVRYKSNKITKKVVKL